MELSASVVKTAGVKKEQKQIILAWTKKKVLDIKNSQFNVLDYITSFAYLLVIQSLRTATLNIFNLRFGIELVCLFFWTYD